MNTYSQMMSQDLTWWDFKNEKSPSAWLMIKESQKRAYTFRQIPACVHMQKQNHSCSSLLFLCGPFQVSAIDSCWLHWILSTQYLSSHFPPLHTYKMKFQPFPSLTYVYDIDVRFPFAWDHTVFIKWPRFLEPTSFFLFLLVCPHDLYKMRVGFIIL